jgi:hypothetical protein
MNELKELINICSNAARKSGLTKERSEKILRKTRKALRKNRILKYKA